ncbi:hypothetical protein OG426_48000 [Streptomyces canus]|uniref:hypothetical protein n=1 Tax=Streptomyces canus TaxID=58343 RepID=UPI003865BA8D|nr:hypothetical protein OG426_48000 [Streptomyces canus]
MQVILESGRGGEIPTLPVLLVVPVQWAGSDTAPPPTTDRQADRDHGTELASCNAYFARLAPRDNAS